VAPITGNVGALRSGDVLLARWRETGLVKPSSVKAVLGTVEQTLVLGVLGSLDTADMRQVEVALAEVLGIKLETEA
jgi:hypothetical protein